MKLGPIIAAVAGSAAVPLSVFLLMALRPHAPAAIAAPASAAHAIACTSIGAEFERCETDEITCYRTTTRSSDNYGRLQCRWKG